MKTTTILIGLAGLMAVVAAEVQNYATAATSDQSTATVVDAQGNLRVPGDYRIAYQLLGAWAIQPIKAPVQRNSTSSTRRLAPSPPIARTGISLTAQCW